MDENCRFSNLQKTLSKRFVVRNIFLSHSEWPIRLIFIFSTQKKVQDSDNDGTYVSEGNKTLLIYYNYPVKSFDGKKYFVIATTSWIGGKNFFLGKS